MMVIAPPTTSPLSQHFDLSSLPPFSPSLSFHPFPLPPPCLVPSTMSQSLDISRPSCTMPLFYDPSGGHGNTPNVAMATVNDTLYPGAYSDHLRLPPHHIGNKPHYTSTTSHTPATSHTSATGMFGHFKLQLPPSVAPPPPTSLSTTPHLPLPVNSGHLPPSTTFDALKLQSFPPLWPHPLHVWPGALSLAWSHTDTPPMQCSCCPYAHRHGDPAPVYCPPHHS